MAAHPTEGVIHFVAHHAVEPLPDLPAATVATLRTWRDLLWRLGLLGQDPARYDGAAFGNVSVRLPQGGLLVTGSQTGGVPILGPDGLVVVDRVDVPQNQVWSRGPVLPSSESMTHAALYALDAGIEAVVHVHSPAIFERAAVLGLPETSASVPYGTPEMALEMGRLWRGSALPAVGIFIIPGHQDGVVGVGASLEQACTRVVAALASAMAWV